MDEVLKQKLQQLKAKYINSMPEKQMELNYFWDVFRGKPNEDNYKNLRIKLHDLIGSSGLYECDELYEVCQKALASLKQGDEVETLGQIVDSVIASMKSLSSQKN